MSAAVSKFKLKMKLQGLELEIEGSREDASLMSDNIGQQIAGLLRPVSNIIDGETESHASSSPSPRVISLPMGGSNKKTYRRRQGAPSSSSNDAAAPAIDFKHTPEKFGNPKQQWKTAQKASWLLYVVQETTGVNELTTKSIVDTFNKHFRQFGKITTSNVTRDLGKLRSATPTPIGEDTTKTPSTWYLTDEGRKQAQASVADALGQGQAA